MARDANDDEADTKVEVEVDISSLGETASSSMRAGVRPNVGSSLGQHPADSEPRTLEPQMAVRGLAIPSLVMPEDEENSVVTVERPKLPSDLPLLNLYDDEEERTSHSLESRLLDVYSMRPRPLAGSGRAKRESAAPTQAFDAGASSIEITHTPATLASATGIRGEDERLGTDPDMSEPTAKRAPIVVPPSGPNVDEEEEERTVADARHGLEERLAALPDEDEEDRTEKKSLRHLIAGIPDSDSDVGHVGGTVKMVLDPAMVRALANAEPVAPAAGARPRAPGSLAKTLLSPEHTQPAKTVKHPPTNLLTQDHTERQATRPVAQNLQVTAALPPMAPPLAGAVPAAAAPPHAPPLGAPAPPPQTPPPAATTARATRYDQAGSPPAPARPKRGGRLFAVFFFGLLAVAAAAAGYRVRPRAFIRPSSVPTAPAAPSSAPPPALSASASAVPNASASAASAAPSASSATGDARDATGAAASSSARGKGPSPQPVRPGPRHL